MCKIYGNLNAQTRLAKVSFLRVTTQFRFQIIHRYSKVFIFFQFDFLAFGKL